MKNPLHSYLYKEYVKQITHINKYSSDIRQYKQFLSQKGNNKFANERTHFKLKTNKRKIKISPINSKVPQT